MTAEQLSAHALQIKQELTAVPYRYRASLTWNERVPTRDEPPGTKRLFGDPEHRPYGLSTHTMHLSGWLHPKEYSFQAATDLAMQKMELFVSAGWGIASLIVTGHSEKDA
jgi:hypothetical protein